MIFCPGWASLQGDPGWNVCERSGGWKKPVLQSLALGHIQEKTAFILATLSREEQRALLELTDTLGMNANKRAEVISHLADLSVFHGKPILEFLHVEEARSIVHDEDIPRPERAARFRRLIRSWKFPELVNSELEFEEWLRGLPNLKELWCARPQDSRAANARLRSGRNLGKKRRGY